MATVNIRSLVVPAHLSAPPDARPSATTLV